MVPQNNVASGGPGVTVDLFYCARVIWKNRWMEIGVVLVACLSAGFYTLRLPKEYEATAAVLAPAEADGAGSLRALGPQGGLVAGLLSLPVSTKDTVIGILKSRTMLDDVIKKFDLTRVYKVVGSQTPMQSSRDALTAMTDIKVSREGVISVTVTAYDPTMAAEMANFYVEDLDRLNASINITQAGRSRRFLEQRLEETGKALKGAEDCLREYQSRSKAVVMEGQARAAIEAVGKLDGEIRAAEVQLKILETYSTPRNPDVIRLQESIKEMQHQLKRMEQGRASGLSKGESGGTVAEYSVTLGSIPSTGIEMARLLREGKIQETIYTLLSQQLEQAKIAEAKDTPTVRILDRAVPPEWKSRPYVLKNITVAAALSLFVGVLLAFALDGIGRIRGRRRTT